jgi:hypothetical protein
LNGIQKRGGLKIWRHWSGSSLKSLIKYLVWKYYQGHYDVQDLKPYLACLSGLSISRHLYASVKNKGKIFYLIYWKG